MKIQLHSFSLKITQWLLIGLALMPAPGNAVEIQEVISDKGIHAYLVESHTNPIVTISFSFAGGASIDPVGKAGLARWLSTMLDEGAGKLGGQEFQARSEELGIDIGFGAHRDNFSGSMQTLAEHTDEAFEMLRLALNEPRFDQHPMERMKTSLLQGIKRSQNRPGTLASKALRKSIFGTHAYGRPVNGTADSLAQLTRDDLIGAHKALITLDKVTIGVVGAINEAKLKAKLDEVFAALPVSNRNEETAPPTMKFGETIHISQNNPQTQIAIAMAGVTRDDPDFFAAYLVNHILGGGAFSSRIYQEVREKRGLAYSASSSLSTSRQAGFMLMTAATRSDRADKTLNIMKQEIAKMAKDGPTAEELEAAKKYIIGSYAIRNLDTSAKVASTAVAIQQIKLGIDYIDKRADLIKAVSIDDAKRVAHKLLSAPMTIVTVGPSALE